MTPTVVWASGLVLGLAVFTSSAIPLAAQQQDESKLRLRRVVMFSSGVSFYEHSGKVEGDANVDLKFSTSDINDLLKSLVLQDSGGGKVSTVTYSSRAPITRVLDTFAIDLTENPTLGDLLNQVRGENVELETPTQVTGTILGVESKAVQVDQQVAQAEFLNVLTEAGLRSIPLENINRVKLLDEKLNAELVQALAILASGHSTDKKTVTLKFRGQGNRTVRVGYIQEAPIWKTSYRLVLSDEKPFLQGWAIVENTTEMDWKDVALTLVSGRPISFRMDLYQPLFVPRPVVQPELYASLRPQTYDQDLQKAERLFREMAEGGQRTKDRRETLKQATPADAAESLSASEDDETDRGIRGPTPAIDPTQGIRSVAQAGQVGELFRYVIDAPVTLPRRQSAMLPIVNQSIQAQKVSIYNQKVQLKHPLNGLRLTNTTQQHLMQGPITVFDEGAYAGDAQILDLEPGAERLISYALDLDVEVAPETKQEPVAITAAKIVRGILQVTRKYRRVKQWVVKNSSKSVKTVLIESPKSHWKLVQPAEASESTRDRHRFAVKAPPGIPQTLRIVEEHSAGSTYALTNLDLNSIRFYVNARSIPATIQQALSEVIARRQAISRIAARQQQAKRQLRVIDQEQSRIRQNMEQIPRDTDLYARYVTKFGKQEDEVERLRDRIDQLSEEQQTLQNSLNDFLQNLTVEVAAAG